MSGDGKRNPVRPPGWPEGAGQALVPPLQPATVYGAAGPDALDAIYEGRATGFTYSREAHPNAQRLAGRLDALEGVPAGADGGPGGIVTSSGMSAISALLLGHLAAGDHVVAGDRLYGRSLRLMTQDLPRLGLAVTLADPGDAGAVRAACTDATRLILVETVSNPDLAVADIDGLAAVAREAGAVLAVDNTFATPLGFTPLAHGADVVIHSLTKLVAGHSDVLLGYVGARDPALAEALSTAAQSWGLTGSPWDCWMAERGMATLELRHARASENAARLAAFLADAPGVARVIFPGRADHPDHARAAALFGGRFGTMVSFELDGGRDAVTAFLRGAEGLAFAPTLGDVVTTLSHPPSSSHRSMPRDAREAAGIGEGFLRVSAGIEPAEWLLARFAAGLAAL